MGKADVTIVHHIRRTLTVYWRNTGSKWGGAIPSSRLRHVLFALFVTGILAYGAAFAGYLLARFDLINLLRDVNNDDAFYYFQIAYHLAEGRFSTFDGGITRTNGYHPLWLLLITPFYRVFDKETALFGIKALEIMLVAGGVALIAAAARGARLPWLLLFATLPLLYQHHALLVGMEAAAALCLLGLFFLALILYVRAPQRGSWPLAAVAFALPWVRLEYMAISLAATAVLGLMAWARRERPPGVSWRAAVRSLPTLSSIVPLLGAVGGILVYFAYNQLVFGGIVPVSGATKQMWSQRAWELEGGYGLVQNFRDTLQIPVFDHELLVALEICAYLLLVWWWVRRSPSRADGLLLAFLVGMFGLAAGHLAQFAQTVLTVHPEWVDGMWYYTPAYLMMALVMPVRCYVVLGLMRRFVRPRSTRAAHLLSLGLVVAGTVWLSAQAGFAAPFRFVDQRHASQSTYGMNLSNYAGMQVMNRVLPRDSRLGVWDAGATGYFADFPVVNLDGLVNDYEFLRQYSASKMYGGGFYHLDDYAQTLHQRFGITHYANTWPIPVTPDFDDHILYEGAFESGSTGGLPHAFQLWSEEPGAAERAPDPAAWFWARMAPHLDSRSAGVALLVDGRLAQAFARDCTPDTLAVWSWTGPAPGAAGRLWRRTQTGLCVNAHLLPHNAVPPVRVDMTLRDYRARMVGDSKPAIRSDFDVHLIAHRLVYVKEPCTRQDVEATFFLHLDPVDRDDLPAWRKPHGFDNLDFRFDSHGLIADGICWAEVPLSHLYGIAEIRTGQYVPVAGGFHHLWEGRFRPAR